MLDILLVLVVTIYFLVMGALFIYLLNFVFLTFLSWRGRRVLSQGTPEMPFVLPRVTIQLPIYNEWYVAERLIRTAAVLEYPPELVDIQVLDDSDDETTKLVTEVVVELRGQEINIRHIHRNDRRGFKAGALAEALESAAGEYIAIFDADFIPQTDFLLRMLPHFDHPRVAFVQARWGHLNRDYSLLTFLQSLALDAHFAVDQLARSGAGLIFNFNGTAGIWRKAAILDAGGWRSSTFAEDLDLSYRVFLKGWMARYAGEVEIPAELPVSFTAFRRQQFRWARGGMECAMTLLPTIWRSGMSLLRKTQASLHLTGFGLHFLVLALIGLYPLLILASREFPTLLTTNGLGLYLNLFFFAPTLYYTFAQALLKRQWLGYLPFTFLSTLMISAMVINTLFAAFQILFRKDAPFERTPKYGITHKAQQWDHSRYSIKIDMIIVVEFILAIYNFWTAWVSGHASLWFIMIYTCMIALALLVVSGTTLLQSLARRSNG